VTAEAGLAKAVLDESPTLDAIDPCLLPTSKLFDRHVDLSQLEAS
jgi:hypothetical protein